MAWPSRVYPPPFPPLSHFPNSTPTLPASPITRRSRKQERKKNKGRGASAWLVTMVTVAGYSATIIPVPHTCDYLKLSIECSSHCCPTRPCSTRQGRELQAPGPSCLIELGSAPGATDGGHRVSPGETSGISLQLGGGSLLRIPSRGQPEAVPSHWVIG